MIKKNYPLKGLLKRVLITALFSCLLFALTACAETTISTSLPESITQTEDVSSNPTAEDSESTATPDSNAFENRTTQSESSESKGENMKPQTDNTSTVQAPETTPEPAMTEEPKAPEITPEPAMTEEPKAPETTPEPAMTEEPKAPETTPEPSKAPETTPEPAMTEEPKAPEATPEPSEETVPPAPPKIKVLVAYFSCTNTTKPLAEYVADELDADLYEITPLDPYTDADLNYGNDSSRSTKEMNDPNSRPAISGSVADMSQYDIVFIGYPIWWGEAPRIVSTFMESYDFSGKTIIPFCTSGGSGIGSSGTNLEKLTSGATWLSGRRFGGGTSRSTMNSWVNSLGLNVTAK